MDDSPDQAEGILARRVAAVLDGRNTNVDEAPALGSPLAWLFERLLEAEETWSRYAWIDDATPDTSE